MNGRQPYPEPKANGSPVQARVSAMAPKGISIVKAALAKKLKPGRVKRIMADAPSGLESGTE